MRPIATDLRQETFFSKLSAKSLADRTSLKLPKSAWARKPIPRKLMFLTLRQRAHGREAVESEKLET